MLLSRFLSSTSLALLAGCPSGGDPPFCGPGDDAEGGSLAVTGADDVRIEYGELTAAANNDCPAPSPPDGLISVTIFARQLDPPGNGLLTFCLPRPDLLEGDADGVTEPLLPDTQPAGADDRIHLIDLEADLGDGTRWEWDAAFAVSGTARFRGLCGEAVRDEPWDLTLEASTGVVVDDGAPPTTTVGVTLEGTAVVEPTPP